MQLQFGVLCFPSLLPAYYFQNSVLSLVRRKKKSSSGSLMCASVRLSKSMSNVMGDGKHTGKAYTGTTELKWPIQSEHKYFYSKSTYFSTKLSLPF